jgi:hypothetical protein
VSEIYVPILQRLSERYEIIGFTTRSSSTSNRFKEKTGVRPFQDAATMVTSEQPDFLVAAVASDANVRTLERLIDLKIPVLAETPLAWRVSDGQKLIRKAAEKKVPIAVAEQFTYRPLERFKHQLIRLGIFGEIYAAHNDFSGYSYHGISQLRRYLSGNPISVRSVEHDFGRSNDTRLPEHWSRIKWLLGSVAFDSGAMLFHHYSDHYGASDLCFPRSTRFYGRAGTMVDYDIRFLNPKSGRTACVKAIRQENDVVTLESISAVLPDIGECTWSNPYLMYPFSDEQIAVAILLDGFSQSLLTCSSPLYTAEENLIDIAIVWAFRHSAHRNGAEIRLPYSEIIQKGLSAIRGKKRT